MPAQILDGRSVSQEIKQELRQAVHSRLSQGLPPPGLAAVLVGANPASQTYVAAKEKACTEVGFLSRVHTLPESATQAELLALIAELNADAAISGILVQLPLPRHISETVVLQAIAPHKDVDGFHPSNVGRLVQGLPTFLPATPGGIIELLKRTGYEKLDGWEAVVIGRSQIVGTPMALLLSRAAQPGNCTVTLTHSRTRDLSSHTRRADLLVVAAGIPALLTPEMVKPGAVVIDVGIHRIADASKKSGFRLVGDVQPDVAQVAAALSPVPGGVGPMTIAQLLLNTWQAAQQ